jgi:hypothetical protein
MLSSIGSLLSLFDKKHVIPRACRTNAIASVENILQALWRCTYISSHCLLYSAYIYMHIHRTVFLLSSISTSSTILRDPRDSLKRHGTHTTIRSRTGTKLHTDRVLFHKLISLQWMDEYEVTAKYNLAETCCASISIDELLALSEDKTATVGQLLDSSKVQGYGEIRGSTELRNNLSRLYSSKVGTPLPAENILITPGAIAANHLALYALVGPGDHVICHYPTYQQLYSIPESLGAEVSLWKSKAENKWLPDLEELKALVKPNTKLIIIKYVPLNPICHPQTRPKNPLTLPPKQPPKPHRRHPPQTPPPRPHRLRPVQISPHPQR